MAGLRLAWRLFRVILHLALGTLIIATYFPFASERTRQRLIRWWSRGVLRICGVRLATHGTVAENQGMLVVLNHVSWIDIYVVHALAATRFVAKSEIRSWPLIGYLCDRTGTLFIERGRRHAVHAANQKVTQVLAEGGRVGVFPEGTTTLGDRLLPFHANLIQAAIEAKVPLVPMALRYSLSSGARADEAAYVGDTSLIESLCTILRTRRIFAHLTVLAPIPTEGRKRHELAESAYRSIATSLGVDIADRKPEPARDFQGELQ